MLILTYFLLLALFIGALIWRKQIMEATVGKIEKGALSLNNRVQNWASRQAMENPASPIAKLGYTNQLKKMQARREIYDKIRKKNAGQSSNRKKGSEGSGVDNDMPPGNSGNPVENEIRDGSSGKASDKIAYSRQHSDDTSEPANIEANGLSEQVQEPVDGLQEMPEEARRAFGWRAQGEQGEGQGGEVFGPWDDIPQEARKASKYGVPMEDGTMQTVYGTWEKTPEGPVLRENYWTLHKSPRAYRITKEDGKVVARKIFDTGDQQNSNAQEVPDSRPEADRSARAANRKVNTRKTSQGSFTPASDHTGVAKDGTAAKEESRSGKNYSEKTVQKPEAPVNTRAQQRRTPIDYGAKHFSKESKEKVTGERVGISQAEGAGGGAGHGVSNDPEKVNTFGNQDATLKGRDVQGGTGSEPGAN